MNHEQYWLTDHRPNNYSKDLTTLLKFYSDKSKYFGKWDVFDYKFENFLRNYENLDIPKSGLQTAFPIILKNEALNFYHSFHREDEYLSLEIICTKFKNNFEGVEYRRTLLATWNRLIFDSIWNDPENSGKITSEFFQILTQKLRLIHHDLDRSMRIDAFIHNKIVTACGNEPVFKNACGRPTYTLNGLISELRSSAELHDR